MPKPLKYGPQPYVSDSNPEWKERQHAPADAMLQPEKDAPLPAAYPIDLYYLSQQTFAHNTDAMKRWFLTAFVAPEDRHLLQPPADRQPATQLLNDIKTDLDKPANSSASTSLQSLRQKVIALFKLEQWLGVGLLMVDKKALSIDMLNTLIQWQALYIQFGEKFFALDLESVSTNEAQPTVHHIIYAQAQLTVEDLKNNEWGKIVSMRTATWEPTLENYAKAIISHYKYMCIHEKHLGVRSPSALLIEHELATQSHPSHIIPLHSLGNVVFEDFCAAAFFGARPMQAYLPSAKGNLYWAHGLYYGEALMAHHDYLHAAIYPEAEKECFVKKLRLLAIIANAMVRINMTQIANEIVDQGSFISLYYKLVLRSKTKRSAEALAQRKTMLAAVYHEFSLAAGIDLAFICTRDTENKDVYHLASQQENQTLSFTINLSGHKDEVSFVDCFQGHYDAIRSLAQQQNTPSNDYTRSCLLRQYQTQTQAQPPVPSSLEFAKNTIK